MTNKVISITFISLIAMIFQVNLLHSKTLQELNIALEVVEVNEWEKTTNVLGEMINTEDYCRNLGSVKKNKQELREYFLNSAIIDSDSKSLYGIWQCSYDGKIKIFGKIWDFWSVSGVTRISRKINKTYKNTNGFEKYCENNICYEVIYFICANETCSPRASLMDEYHKE